MGGSNNQYACRLACQLIKTHHGEITEVRPQWIVRALQSAAENPSPAPGRLLLGLLAPETITSSFFTSSSQKVCKYLATRGTQTLSDIGRGTGLPLSQIKQSLLLMVQHNYVVAYTHKDEEGPKGGKPPYNMYRVDVDMVLQILRSVPQPSSSSCTCCSLLRWAVQQQVQLASGRPWGP